MTTTMTAPAVTTTDTTPDVEMPVSPRDRAMATLTHAHRILDLHSIDVLRVSLGLVFLVFGALKFFPGLSPAADLAARTIDTLTLGVISGDFAIFLTATMETFIGITLVSGRFLKAGLATLGMAMVGILSPLVLFTGELFPDGPTLVAQYVMKDIVLVSAGLVVAAHALGARLERR
ncbi:MAG: DoxX family protein [Marmoricola sp.]|nr:DoxX family protein [Marmoricola sp.]